MKIYMDKSGEFHRDGKSAGAGSRAFEFDHKTKAGCISLLNQVKHALGHVTPVEAPYEPAKAGLPRPGSDDTWGPFDTPPEDSTGSWRLYYKGLFVGIAQAPTPSEARDKVANLMVARRRLA